MPGNTLKGRGDMYASAGRKAGAVGRWKMVPVEGTSVGGGYPRPRQVGCDLSSHAVGCKPGGRSLPDARRHQQPARSRLTKAGLQFPACSGSVG